MLASSNGASISSRIQNGVGLANIIANNILMVSLINPTYVLTMLSWQFALGGIAVGGIASYIALRKFLVV